MKMSKNHLGFAATALALTALMGHAAMAQNALPAAPTASVAPAPKVPKLDLTVPKTYFLPPLRSHSSSTFTPPPTEAKTVEKPLIQVPDKLKGVVKWPTFAGVEVRVTSHKFGGGPK